MQKNPSVFVLTLLALAFSASRSAWAVSGDDFEFHGYLRAGARANSQDAANECYSNKGPAKSINEFRLGNECGDYGELTLLAHNVKGKTATDPFFRTRVTLNFFTSGNTSVEDLKPGLFEAYVDAGNYFDSNIKYWVGKRIYRDAAVHMNDDFYFANINGNGAGVYDIAAPSGTLAFAYFIEQGNPYTSTAKNASRDLQVKAHLFDARWQNLKIAEKQKLDLWGAFATSRGGSVYTDALATSQVEYDKGTGFAAGVKHKYELGDGSENDLSLQYGTKILEGLGLASTILYDPSSAAPGTSLVNDKNRLRLIDDLVYQVTDRISFELAGRFERFHGTLESDKGTWWSVGSRPTYFFNDHFGLAVEGGISSIKTDGDQYTSYLKRVTIAPLLAANSKYFGRPQLRAYFSNTFGYGNAYGVQAETWF